MDWLVESLLKLAKLDAGTARFCPETIPLSALLARAAEPFAIGMELRGQQLQVEASGNVRCDPRGRRRPRQHSEKLLGA